MNPGNLVVGIDVAKNSLAVAIENESFSVGNDAAGLAQLLARLLPLKPELVGGAGGLGRIREGGLARVVRGRDQGRAHQSARCLSLRASDSAGRAPPERRAETNSAGLSPDQAASAANPSASGRLSCAIRASVEGWTAVSTATCFQFIRRDSRVALRAL